MTKFFFQCLSIGFVGGVLFGVFFGAFASVFHNGPTLLQGITESWWWFAIVGLFIGLGYARAYALHPIRFAPSASAQ